MTAAANRVNEEAGKLYQAEKALAALVVDGLNYSHTDGLKAAAGFLRKAVQAGVTSSADPLSLLLLSKTSVPCQKAALFLQRSHLEG